MDGYYDSDDASPPSPGLIPFRPSASLSPSPPRVPRYEMDTIHPDLDEGLKAGWSLANPAASHLMDDLLLTAITPDRPDIAHVLRLTDFEGGEKNVEFADLDRFIPNKDQSMLLESFRKPKELRRKMKTRSGLPLTLMAQGGPATVLACADTGSEENIISDDLARLLGYAPYENTFEAKQFMLANGRTVQAVGKIVAQCSFGIETAQLVSSISCVFYVLLELASPLIMGMPFLEDTRTMTEHTERLVKVPRPSFQALQVKSVGRPRKQLICYLDGHLTLATPDTGSEVNLMSPDFARERGFSVEHCEEWIEYADGSVAMTLGSLKTSVLVTNEVRSGAKGSDRSRVSMTFLIALGLTHDLIIGEEALEELEVFTKFTLSVIPAPDVIGPARLNRIRYIGAIDQALSWIRKRLSGHSDQQVSHTELTNLVEDQRENDRREREAQIIANLCGSEQESAVIAEAQRQANYDLLMSTRPPNYVPSSSTNLEDTIMPSSASYLRGSFRCSHAGCKAPPFQTQYLLDSHSNIHPQRRFFQRRSFHKQLFHRRSLFCPVSGCPRAASGRGFKRKNEMLRHSLVHRSPRYICPFCADGGHQYSASDDLKRHVRDHHTEKTADDPALVAVLNYPFIP